MPEYCFPIQKKESRKVIQNNPDNGHTSDLHDLWFQWEPPWMERWDSPLTYRLLVYRYRPGEAFLRAVKGEPVYIADNLQTPFHKYSGQSGILKRNMAYCWKVEAWSRENRLVDTSFTQGFRLCPSDQRSPGQNIDPAYPLPAINSAEYAGKDPLYLVPSLFTRTAREWDYRPKDTDEQMLIRIDSQGSNHLHDSGAAGEESGGKRCCEEQGATDN